MASFREKTNDDQTTFVQRNEKTILIVNEWFLNCSFNRTWRKTIVFHWTNEFSERFWKNYNFCWKRTIFSNKLLTIGSSERTFFSNKLLKPILFFTERTILFNNGSVRKLTTYEIDGKWTKFLRKKGTNFFWNDWKNLRNWSFTNN